MITTIREQNLEYAYQILVNDAPDTIGADRNRDDEPTPDEMPMRVLFDGGHQTQTIACGEENKKMGFTVQGYVTADANQDKAAIRAALRLAVDDLYGHTILAFGADPTFGGLAVDVVETNFADPEFILSEGDIPFAVIAIDFEVEFVHAEKNPYSL